MASKKDQLKANMEKAAQQTAAASYITSDQGPEKKENKTARTTFLLRPSVYADFRTISDALRITPNELINTMMEEFVEQHRDILERELEYRRATEEAFKKG